MRRLRFIEIKSLAKGCTMGKKEKQEGRKQDQIKNTMGRGICLAHGQPAPNMVPKVQPELVPKLQYNWVWLQDPPPK